MDSNLIIDRLGGTTAAAKFFEVKAPSVSEWRKTGLPRARLMYVRAMRPDIYAEAEKVGAGTTAQSAHEANVIAAGSQSKNLDLSQLAQEGA